MIKLGIYIGLIAAAVTLVGFILLMAARYLVDCMPDMDDEDE
jgi:hypothetical protein